jgi:hypothetical protein
MWERSLGGGGKKMAQIGVYIRDKTRGGKSKKKEERGNIKEN